MSKLSLEIQERLKMAAIRFSIEREEEYATFLKENYPELYKLVVTDSSN